MKRNYGIIRKVAVAVCALGMMTGTAWGQSNTYDHVSVVSKTGMWYDSDYYTRNAEGNDTFDDASNGMEGGRQKVHEYREYIYVNPGQSVDLWIPSQGRDNGTDGGFNYKYYQRWYDYETNGSVNSGTLTPLGGNWQSGTDRNRGYNLSNGLVGGTIMEEINNWNANTSPLWHVRYTAPNNNFTDEIQIACDASRYLDGSYNNNRLTEPTLSVRCIFIIKNARTLNLNTSTYREYYTIHYPTERIGTTNEVLSLEMNARNYFRPDQRNAENAGNLTITKEDPNNIISSLTSYISGENRVIRFNTNDRNMRNGATATINVANGSYLVAQYTLIFDENTEGIVFNDVQAIQENDENYLRTNAYFREEGFEELNRINFEYTNITTTPDYYPYPVNWDYNTYGFFAPRRYLNGNYNREDRDLPQSAEYAIISYDHLQDATSGKHQEGRDWVYDDNTIPLVDNNDLLRNFDDITDNNYCLYVDASDKPGTVVKARLRENLCAGARMYVTAWIKNQGWGAWGNNENSDGTAEAGFVFILKGVASNGDETELYRHASGQIPRIYSSGKMESDWYQVYFSYINDNETFDHYVLQIDNNCASSSGGDILLDEVRIYMAPLDIEASTENPVCSDDDVANVKMRINFDLLLDRLGLEEATGNAGESLTGHYSLLHKDTYDENLANNDQNYATAFEKALVHGDGVYGEGTTNYGNFAFNTNFGKNANTETSRGNRWLTVTSSISSNGAVDEDGTIRSLMPGETYYIAYYAPNTAESDNVASSSSISDLAAAYAFNTRCAIKGEFTVQGYLVVKIDGDVEAVQNNIPCINQVPSVSVEMTDEDGTVIEGVKFDWYFGTLEEFKNIRINETAGDVYENTLEYALEMFRHFYPNNTQIDNTVVPREETGEDGLHYELTDEAIALIETLNREKPEDAENPVLTLAASDELVIRLRQADTYIVLIPTGTKPDDATLVCWEPMPLHLRAQNYAPVLNIGFQEVRYPEDEFVEGESIRARMDLARIEELQEDNLRLHIPVRLPENATETYLEMTDDKGLYLFQTDDPDYDISENGDYEIGEVTYLNMDQNNNNGRYAHLSFDTKTTSAVSFREGYTYWVKFKFKERGVSGGTACDGELAFPIVIVPQYQKWIGTANGNWNNDDLWQRSEYDELNKTTNSYTTNTVNETSNGFVPLSSTYVTIPKGAQVQLYSVSSSSDGIADLETNKPAEVDRATAHIEYDLVIGDSKRTGIGNIQEYQMLKYTTNKAKEIHFEPNTEMLHTELLTYEKAWVDYELAKGRWYTLASPLQGVVAGDFYTDKSGKEGQAYFSDINYDPNNNNRFSPSVYQRAWKGSATLQTLNSGPKEVAIEGNWSSVYNDVTVPYSEGAGFSLKVQDITGDKALFRLPKADGSYTYYNSDGSTASTPQTETITRTGTVHELYTGPVDVNLSEAQDGTHYLVGNPYMAHINATMFFEQNPGLLKKYWLVDEDGQKVAVGSEEIMTSTDVDATIAPLQSFFVEKDPNATEQKTVTFTTSMQILGTDVNDNLRSSDVLYLTATTPDGKQSRAALAYNLAADKDYEASEDAELFLDSNLSDVPMVYTVAGTMATSINQTSELYNIPVGVYSAGATGENVSLSFSGLNGFSYATLYDAETGTDTPLHEGSSLSVPANTNGRYFLRAGVPTANEAVQENAIRIYSVGGQLVIASTDPLQQVYIYDFAGRLVDSETGLHTTRYTTDLPAGNYMVKARSVSGEKIEKFKLRN